MMMEGEEMEPMNRQKKNKKKSKKNKKKNKKNKKNKKQNKSGEEMEEGMSMDEMVLEAVQNMAYFGCVHDGMEKACNAKVNKFTKMMMEKMEENCDTREEFEAKWAEVGLLDEGRLAEVPPRRAMVSFDSGVDIQTGQRLLTEQVSLLTFY